MYFSLTVTLRIKNQNCKKYINFYTHYTCGKLLPESQVLAHRWLLFFVFLNIFYITKCLCSNVVMYCSVGCFICLFVCLLWFFLLLSFYFLLRFVLSLFRRLVNLFHVHTLQKGEWLSHSPF